MSLIRDVLEDKARRCHGEAGGRQEYNFDFLGCCHNASCYDGDVCLLVNLEAMMFLVACLANLRARFCALILRKRGEVEENSKADEGYRTSALCSKEAAKPVVEKHASQDSNESRSPFSHPLLSAECNFVPFQPSLLSPGACDFSMSVNIRTAARPLVSYR